MPQERGPPPSPGSRRWCRLLALSRLRDAAPWMALGASAPSASSHSGSGLPWWPFVADVSAGPRSICTPPLGKYFIWLITMNALSFAAAYWQLYLYLNGNRLRKGVGKCQVSSAIQSLIHKRFLGLFLAIPPTVISTAGFYHPLCPLRWKQFARAGSNNNC